MVIRYEPSRSQVQQGRIVEDTSGRNLNTQSLLVEGSTRRNSGVGVVFIIPRCRQYGYSAVKPFGPLEMVEPGS